MNVNLPKEYLKPLNNDSIPIETTSTDVKSIYGINGDLEKLYIKQNEHTKKTKLID